MHFKSAQIAGVELSPSDLAQINRYSLSPLTSDEIFAFKVSMAANEIDRDFEVFPHATLVKLANMFIGKTVVKDHDHKSDNQIARIYDTELVDSDHMRLTRSGEPLTELIAKCYMVRTSKNADLISEIQAGIRKEVSLGCRIGKAVCSICDTDNVKTYCTHFAGKHYDGKVCFFSLLDPQDAYELSFVAIPAQQHAGTVKSYGEKPCYQKDMDATARKQAKPDGEAQAAQAPDENLGDPSAGGLRELSGHEGAQEALTEQASSQEYERLSAELSDLSAKVGDLVALLAASVAGEKDGAAAGAPAADMPEDARTAPENAPNAPKNTQKEPENAPNAPENAPTRADSAPEKPHDAAKDGDDEPETGIGPKSDADRSRSAAGREGEPSTDGEASAPVGEGDKLAMQPDALPSPESIAKAEDAAKSAQVLARLRALEMAIALQRTASEPEHHKEDRDE